MSIDNDTGDVRIYGLQIGEVVDRNDPLNLGRVRVRIPGLVDDAGAWAFPLGAPGGGTKQRGLKFVPRLHAEVGVLFKGGDPDHPYYLPAQWGTGEMLTDAASKSASEAPDVDCLETERYAITIDNREGQESLTIKDKVSGDSIEFDGSPATGPGITITATAALYIKVAGVFVVESLSASINGRQVVDGPQNI